MDELLTQEERDLIRDTGRLYTRAENIVSAGPTRETDLAELRSAIHVIQRAIGYQAAARRYPAEIRLLGDIISR